MARKRLFESVARRPLHKPGKTLLKPAEGIPGPSNNPKTNFILADAAFRAVGYLARRSVERGLLAGRYGDRTATAIVRKKTVSQSLISLLLARVATTSVPGAMLVGGGALAKTLLDRRKGRHRAKAEGDRALLEQAREE